MLKQPNATMPLWLHVAWSFVYFAASWGLFIATSGGWISLIYFALGVPFLILFVLVAARSARASRSGVHSVSFRWPVIAVLLPLQIVALLFNFGDCGDAAGGYMFWQRLQTGDVLGSRICEFVRAQPPSINTMNTLVLPWLGELLPLLFLAYFATLFVFFVHKPFRKTAKGIQIPA